MKISRKSLVGLFLVLGLSAVLDTVVAWKASATIDESHHVQYGEKVLRFEPDRLSDGFYDSQMPVSALNAAPLVLAAHFETRHLLRPFSAQVKLVLVRIATILATLALNLLVYLWAYDLYGEAAALASCLLCALSPNLIAHGTLATTDMYHALGVVASLFFFRRFLLQPTVTRALASGLILAMTQITKGFAIVLYAIVCLAIVLVVFRRTPSVSLTPRRALLFAAVTAMSFIAIINVAFCFDRTFRPVSYYLGESQHHFYSASIARVRKVPFLVHVPVPVPFPFVQGFALMKRVEKTGYSNWSTGDVYLLGEVRDPHDPAFHGFKSYYAVAFFYKEPIALQVLFLWGLVWICRNRKFRDFVVGEGLLLTAAAVLVLWLSLFSRMQIGIRHILPALAIETIIAGAAFSGFPAKPWPQKALLSALVLWLAGSVASYYPQMIPYMNEWVHDRCFAYRILADSNLDWGQDQTIVSEFLRQNPDVVLDPPAPVAGRILVSANRLTGVSRWGSATYLAQRYQPVAQVGYAHFLFVIPAGDVASAPPRRP
ncbi:MAG TPA: glycosyltransferase family 39 protein [Candidatus Binatia bacterium]|nr:glycosyltransferase family 39 protein [Candidatus Binatia bacterium]